MTADHQMLSWLAAKLDEVEAVAKERDGETWCRAVLRQVSATRKLLKLHRPTSDGDCPTCLGSAYPEGVWMETAPCETLEIEAERWGWAG